MIRCYVVLIALVVSLSIQFSAAQSPHIVLHHVDAEKGLSQVFIRTMTRDNMGYVWIGTNGGLNRFDGYECELVGNQTGDPGHLTDQRISALYCDDSGDLLVSTEDHHLFLWNPIEEVMVQLDSSQAAQEVLDSYVRSILQVPDGRYFITLNNGNLVSWNRSKDEWMTIWSTREDFPSFPTRYEQSSSLALDGKGRLWVAFQNWRLFLLDLEGGSSMKPSLLPLPDQLHFLKEQDANKILYLTPYTSNLLLFQSLSRLTLYDVGGDSILIEYSVSESTDHYWREHVMVDEEGGIWHRLTGKISCWNPVTGKHKELITLEKDYSETALGFKFEDPAGLIWGHDPWGAVYFDPNTPFELYSSRCKPPYKITPQSTRQIQEDPKQPGRFWVSGYYGMDLVEPGIGRVPLEQFPHPSPLANTYYYSFLVDEFPTIYSSGEMQGIDRIQPNARSPKGYQKEKFIPDPDLHFPGIGWENDFYAMIRSSKGEILLGGNTGLFQFDPERGTFRYLLSHVKEGKWEPKVITMVEDEQGVIWAGTESGLLWYDLNSKKSGDHHILNHQRVVVKCLLLQPDGKIWIGTSSHGALLVDKEEIFNPEEPVRVLQLSTKSGFPDDVIYGILPESEEVLWMSSNQGLIRYDIPSGTHRQYTREFGLQDNEFNTASFCRASDGTLYFGGVKGITAFHPDDIPRFNPESNLIYKGISRMGGALGEQAVMNRDRKVVIKPDESIFALEFFTSDFFKAEDRRFAYKINSLHTDWIDLGTDHRIYFTGLAPGSYDLSIRSTNRYGNWVEEERPLRLEIEPHWYETYWFYLGCGVLVLVIGGALFRLRLRQVEKQNVKLEATVADRTEKLAKAVKERDSLLREIHHRVKNNLAVISGLLNIQARTLREPRFTSSINEARSRIYSMALIHKTLYESESMAGIDFRPYVAQLVGDISRSHCPPEKQIEVKVKVDEVFLDLDQAVPIGLIVNEAIINAYKHAFHDRGRGWIQVDFKGDGKGKYTLVIQDDGPGFPADFDPELSMGLTLISDLVDQLEGRINFNNLKGACIEIQF